MVARAKLTTIGSFRYLLWASRIRLSMVMVSYGGYVSGDGVWEVG